MIVEQASARISNCGDRMESTFMLQHSSGKAATNNQVTACAGEWALLGARWPPPRFQAVMIVSKWSRPGHFSTSYAWSGV